MCQKQIFPTCYRQRCQITSDIKMLTIYPCVFFLLGFVLEGINNETEM